MPEKHPAPPAAWLILLLQVVVWPSHAGDDVGVDTWHVDLAPPMNAAAKALADIDAPHALFVGEIHDRLPYHVNQLAAIAALRARQVNVAVGLEMIQAPFQSHLDDFVAGRIDFKTMLARTEYYRRWGYDARLYRPIFDYARHHDIPLIALNASRELTERVGQKGVDDLTADERGALPDTLMPPSPGYRALLEETFREHGALSDTNFERFVQVQLTWDETMAASAARFLESNPDHVVVVLAGVRHIAGGFGIPARFRARSKAGGTIVLSEAEREEQPHGADVFLALPDAELADAGRMGVMIRPAASGAVVDGFAEGSPAEQAGLEANDAIVDIDGRAIESFADLKVALFDRSPGDAVSVTVRRDDDRRVTLSFDLY